MDHYPLPLPEDIFAAVQGGAVFSVIHLSQAYLHLEVDERAPELLTVNTHVRLLFGPAILQAVMDQILQGMPGTACYLDDVIIAGKTHKECKEREEQVVMRLSTHGIKVNADKCRLFEEKVTYFGHEIDRNGLHLTSEKVLVIKNAPKSKRD